MISRFTLICSRCKREGFVIHGDIFVCRHCDRACNQYECAACESCHRSKH